MHGARADYMTKYRTDDIYTTGKERSLKAGSTRSAVHLITEILSNASSPPLVQFQIPRTLCAYSMSLISSQISRLPVRYKIRNITDQCPQGVGSRRKVRGLIIHACNLSPNLYVNLRVELQRKLNRNEWSLLLNH